MGACGGVDCGLQSRRGRQRGRERCGGQRAGRRLCRWSRYWWILKQDPRMTMPGVQDVQEGAAVYFDGASSRKRQVMVRLGSALDIVEDDAVVASWPFDQLRRADGTAGRLRLSCTTAAPLARLEVDDPQTMQAVIARATALDAHRGGPTHTLRIVFWSIAAVCSIVGIALYGIPLAADRLAPLV